MIRDIINEYSINLEYIVANVTELDDGNFETVLVLFDEEGDGSHEIVVGDPISDADVAILRIEEILSEENMLHCLVGHSVSVFYQTGVLEVVCVSSFQVKHDEFIFWKKPDLKDPDITTDYLLEMATQLIKEAKDAQDRTD